MKCLDKFLYFASGVSCFNAILAVELGDTEAQWLLAHF